MSDQCRQTVDAYLISITSHQTSKRKFELEA
jgi:hypothetical protein